MALSDTARLIASLELDPRKFLKGMSQSEKALSRIENRGYRAGAQIATGLQNITRIGVGVAATIGTISIASLKMAGDFEAQLNTINTIARETPEGLDRIGDSIRGIARATGTPLEELTQGYYDLLSAGIKAADAQKVLEASNRLAIGGLASTAEAVDLLTSAINTYGFEASGAAALADIFAKTVERGKVTAAELAASFATVGPTAKAAGIGIYELGAGFAQLTASGVPASEAATQMRSAIVALTRRTGDLKKLEKQTGRNYLSIAGKKGLVAALEQMRIDAKKAGVPLIDLLGRVEGVNFALATTGPNFDAYNANLTEMGDASGTAAEQMAERQKGLNFQLSRLKALARDAGITIGSELLPKLTPLFQRLNEELIKPSTQQALRDFGTKIAGLFSDSNIREGVAAFKGAFQIAKDAAPALADSLKIGGEALKIAVGAFKSLPPEIQKLAVLGLAINKITGGLVTNIAGGLISSVLKQLTSGVVNVRGATVIVTGAGGVGGAPVPAGGGGGGSRLGNAANLLSKVFVVGIAAEAASEFSGPINTLGKDLLAGLRPQEFDDFGAAWERWRASADWPFGQRNAPEWVGGAPQPNTGTVDPFVTAGLPKDRLTPGGKPLPVVDGHVAAQTEKAAARLLAIEASNKRTAMETQRQGERGVGAQVATKASIDASTLKQTAAINEAKREDTRGANATAAAARNAGERARAAAFATRDAINAKDFRPRVTVNAITRVQISARAMLASTTFQQRIAEYG